MLGSGASWKMISVIAPCLNEEKHLPTFLNSLVAQSWKDFEVIIVDGYSFDRSILIMADYFEKLPIKIVFDKTRNFGFIRNLGAKHAKGEIMFHCNTDNYLEPRLLEKIKTFYKDYPETLSLSGRVYPLGTNVIAHLSYQLFDFLRFVFTCAPMPIKKYRPSGNFMSIRSSTFKEVGGYPEVTVNEDGLLGQKLDPYTKTNHKAVAFNLNFYVGHWVKKFEEMGGPKALLFYLYTLTNFAPMLQPLLEPIRNNAGLVFEGKPPTKISSKQLLHNFWEWL